jgi:hypothetical protein
MKTWNELKSLWDQKYLQKIEADSMNSLGMDDGSVDVILLALTSLRQDFVDTMEELLWPST